MRRGVCCLFAGKTSCCQFEFVQQAATDLEYCGNQNNNQINIKYEYHNNQTNHTNGPLINGNDENISHLSLKDFADNNFYRRSGLVNVNDGNFRQQPISSYNFNEMYEQWNVKSDVM